MIDIKDKELDKFLKKFLENDINIVSMNSVCNNGISKSSFNYRNGVLNNHNYSISLDVGDVCNQKQSGRCWMFAALNFMRIEVMKNLNLKNIELSQSYPLFFDKLEKANFFLECIIDTSEMRLDSREVNFLLHDPMQDGGQWDMFKNLVNKYGVVPQEVMPEVNLSSATRELDKYLTLKLREFARDIRNYNDNGMSTSDIRNKKEEMIEEIYKMLSISLGIPPKTFTYETRDKDNNFIRIEDITPQDFFKKYVKLDLDNYVSIINAPTKDKPFYKTFTVKDLGNVYGHDVFYLNLPIDDLKSLAVKQMSDGKAVWFGSDVGQFSTRDTGIMALDIMDVDKLFSTKFNLSKEDRLNYGESLMTHAMLLSGVNLDKNNKPNRYRVENSWGKDVGKDGFFVMSDEWFSEFVYQVVIDKKYLSSEQKEMLKQKPKVLNPWDPMGSLAIVRND